MPQKVLIKMERVKKVNAVSKRIMAAYKKDTKRPVRGSTGFALDLSKMRLGGTVALCKCQCSSSYDCGGGGGGH